MLSIPDFGYFAHKAQIKKSPFGKIVTIKKTTREYDVFSLGHRNPQGLYWDSEKDIILSSEHGPIGGDEININKIEDNGFFHKLGKENGSSMNYLSGGLIYINGDSTLRKYKIRDLI